jgi:hypothetical protein
MAGAALMGTGGVLAMGCTIGQGLTAFSALAMSAPVVMAAIALGARLGLEFTMTGEWLPTLRDLWSARRGRDGRARRWAREGRERRRGALCRDRPDRMGPLARLCANSAVCRFLFDADGPASG